MFNIKVLACCAAITLFACATRESQDTGELKELKEKVAALENQRPMLGQMMNLIQIYHTKLYYAIQNENKELITYILHELEENFELVVNNHGLHDGVDLKQIAESTIIPTIEKMEEDLNTMDKAKMLQSFEFMTINCNNCHVSSNHAFIKIISPTGDTYLNQDFRLSNP